MTGIGAAAFAVVTNMVASDMYERLPSLSVWLTEKAVGLLPEGKRVRFREEWLSHLNECPTKLSQFMHAAGCWAGAVAIARRERSVDFAVDTELLKHLIESNQALKDAERLRNDFVHHVSYELRSPLTNIVGFVELLGDQSVGSLNPKQLEYAGYVTKSSAALLEIINNILDLSTIDMDAMELSPGTVDIAATMREACEGVQDRLAENGVILDIVAADGIGTFRADGKRVRQILFNLLSNAIGFSAAGQRVTLTAIRQNGRVVFTVMDQGRGIPADMLEQVFYRFHSETFGTRHRGVGLGLCIVRSLMELHGGEVLIDSRLGEGTAVTCVFPCG